MVFAIARTLVLAAALIALVAPLPGAAQTSSPQPPRVGILSGWSSTTDFVPALRHELRRLGYVEGRTIALEERYAEGRPERLRELAQELVRLKVDVIVAGNVQAARTASQATRTIPIVIAGGDAVGTGLVTNLAQPGGNITGVTTISTELTGKRLKLLKDTVPQIKRVAVLSLQGNPNTGPALEDARNAARQLAIQVQSVMVRNADELDAAFTAMKSGQAEALLVVPAAIFRIHQRRIIDLARRNGLPTVWEWREAAEEGALLAYGARGSALWQRAATFVDKILKGAKAGSLPMEQPTKFDLVVNLKTAKALGVVVPPAVMVSADELLQ